MTSKPDSLSDAAVLVTGAAGFIGQTLVRKLLGAGAYVVANDLSFSATEAKRGALEPISGEFEKVCGQVAAAVDRAARGWRGVVHLAGMSHAGECERSPQAAFAANVSLAATVLEFSQRNRISRFVLPSTGLVYGDRLKEPARESFPPNPANCYAATKLTAEWVARSFAGDSFCVGVARLGNVYGPGGHPDSVAAEVVRQAAVGGEVAVRDGSPVRDFTYVEDAAEGLLRLLCVVDAGEVTVNLSTGKGTSVAGLVETACRIAGSGARPGPTVAGDETSRLVMANDRLDALTGWRPSISLEDGLSQTLKG